MKKLTLITLLVLLSSNVFAEVITLQQAVDYALKNNNKIKQYNSKLEEKKYSEYEAYGNYLPKFDLVSSYTHLDNPLMIDLNPIRDAMITMQSANQVEFANIYNIMKGNPALSDAQRSILQTQFNQQLNQLLPPFEETLKQQDYKTATIVGVQPIFMGGKIIAGSKFASADKHLSEVELKQIKDEVTREVTKKYLTVLLISDIIKVRKDVIELVTKHLERATKLMKEGLIANFNVLRAEVALAEAEKNLSEDENNLDLALLSLKNEMGMDLNQDISVEGELTFNEFSENLSELLTIAKENNVILQQIEQRKLQAEQKHIADRAAFLPTLAAFGKYELYPNYLSALEPKWAVGLSLNFNVFNGLKDYSKYQSSAALIQEVNYLQKDVEGKIELLVNKNYKDVMNSKDRYFKNQKNISLAAENLRLNEKRFESSLGTSLEVIDANVSYEKTLIDSKKYLYDYYCSLTDLFNTIGKTNDVVQIINNK
ncbi:MAG: TolC family protein [Candidatus Kapaibacteriota bacterium]